MAIAVTLDAAGNFWNENQSEEQREAAKKARIEKAAKFKAGAKRNLGFAGRQAAKVIGSIAMAPGQIRDDIREARDEVAYLALATKVKANELKQAAKKVKTNISNKILAERIHLASARHKAIRKAKEAVKNRVDLIYGDSKHWVQEKLNAGKTKLSNIYENAKFNVQLKAETVKLKVVNKADALKLKANAAIQKRVDKAKLIRDNAILAALIKAEDIKKKAANLKNKAVKAIAGSALVRNVKGAYLSGKNFVNESKMKVKASVNATVGLVKDEAKRFKDNAVKTIAGSAVVQETKKAYKTGKAFTKNTKEVFKEAGKAYSKQMQANKERAQLRRDAQQQFHQKRMMDMQARASR